MRKNFNNHKNLFHYSKFFTVSSIIFLILFSTHLSAQKEKSYKSQSMPSMGSSVLFYVGNWGATGQGMGWPILNDSSTVVGNASMGSDEPPALWATIRGGFDYDVEATTDSAIVVKGKLEFVGDGFQDQYTPIRYALTYQNDPGTLQYQYTDSACWSVNDGNYGYEFTPRSGNGALANGNGGSGTLWTIINGNWNSTYSNGGLPISTVFQAPAYANMVEGVYDWAISVQPLSDGTNEVRWYLIEENNKYWCGGISIDTAQVITKFNGINFGIIQGLNNNLTRFNLTEVRVEKGEPIQEPLPHPIVTYIDQWGFIGGRFGGWKFIPGDIDGNASISGDSELTDWAAIRGEFFDKIKLSEDNALIVKGKIKFIGSGFEGLDGFKFGIFNSDSAGYIIDSPVDSTHWSGKENYHTGYLFSPPGEPNFAEWWVPYSTEGKVINDVWLGTNSYISLGSKLQTPANAVSTEGEYDFAVSVVALTDNVTEVRFFLVKQDNSYFFTDSIIDKHQPLSEQFFNCVCFAVNSTNKNLRRLDLYDVYIDMGEQIKLPEAPWKPYYITRWGFIGNKYGGWKFTPGWLVGDFSISGDSPNRGWAAIEGRFLEPVKIPNNKALVVSGKMEFLNGGFEATNSLRLGMFYSDSTGNLVSSPVDSIHWSGSENYHSGYLFIPPVGNNELLKWNGIPASIGAVVNNIWLNTDGKNNYPIGDILQEPAGVLPASGVYDFAIQVAEIPDTTAEIRFYLIQEDMGYACYGSFIDKNNPLATKKFNCIAFALDSGNTTTAINFYEVQINLYDRIVGVEEPKEDILPATNFLSQNYPNPFNPTTNFVFRIADFGLVSLKIYDTLGREVATVIEKELAPGYYIFPFSISQFPLSSGIYFYQLKAKNYIETKKFVLLK